MKFWPVAFLIASCVCSNAQSTLSQDVVVTGATIHIGNGSVIENGTLVIEKGKIVFAGKTENYKGDTNEKIIIDAIGKHVYPGLISMYTNIGLTELDAVRASNDYAETGEINAHVRSIIAYNTDSDIIPTVRSNGILLAQITPRGGLVAGSSSVAALDGWSWEEAAYKADEGIHVNWPSYYPQQGQNDNAKGKYQEERQNDIDKIRKLLSDAYAYSKTVPVVKNIRLESLRGLFDGSKTLYINANFAKEIIESVTFAKELKVKKIAIAGAKDSYGALDFLKENNIPVVLYRLHQTPSFAESDIDYSYKLPALLKKSGVSFALSYYGEMETAHSRNLAFIAGTAASYGLSKEEALESITLTPAKILGIDKTTGSLETGKDATFLISEGDLLDMKTNRVTYAFLKGKKVDLNDKQKELNKRYNEKYGLK